MIKGCDQELNKTGKNVYRKKDCNSGDKAWSQKREKGSWVRH